MEWRKRREEGNGEEDYKIEYKCCMKLNNKQSVEMR
jgi:hypothetical protein